MLEEEPMSPRTADRIAQARARWLPACTRRPDLWQSGDDEDRAYAVAHCHACPLEPSCRERARDDLTSVRGGTTPEDRLLLLEPAQRAVEHVPSRAAYVSGCRCDGCERENTRYVAEWRARTSPITAAPRIEAFEQLAMEVGS